MDEEDLGIHAVSILLRLCGFGGAGVELTVAEARTKNARSNVGTTIIISSPGLESSVKYLCECSGWWWSCQGLVHPSPVRSPLTLPAFSSERLEVGYGCDKRGTATRVPYSSAVPYTIAG